VQPTPRPCCAPPSNGDGRFERKVIKGGSHLCAPNYCLRYRPAARQSETVDTSTCHIGFRCVVRARAEPPQCCPERQESGSTEGQQGTARAPEQVRCEFRSTKPFIQQPPAFARP